jgi:hypothetical protein
MPDSLSRLAAALSDRYRIERELGQGGVARRRAAEATATERPLGARQRDPGARESFRARPMSLERLVSRFGGHFSDLSRVATERLWERNARPGARESLRAASAADLGANPDG